VLKKCTKIWQNYAETISFSVLKASIFFYRADFPSKKLMFSALKNTAIHGIK
jgi:hypothetical protein